MPTYDTFSQPYDAYMNRSADGVVAGSSNQPTLNTSGNTQAPGGGVETATNIGSSQVATSTNTNSNGNTENMPVKSGGALSDLWIDTFIKSSNWKPKTQGFWLDGPTGYAEFVNVYVSGNINALTGSIGGFEIGADYIRDISNTFGLSSTITGGDDVRFWAGDTFANRASAPFRITESGFVYASNGEFSGTFNIGGTTITIDNTGDIQASLDEIEAAGGGTLFLQNGTYTLTSDISIPGGVTLEGVSRDGVIIDCNSSYVVKITGTNTYSTGTITINNGDTTVVGSGTTWTSGMVGRQILLEGLWYEITAFTDTTHITIDMYGGSDLSANSYVLASVNFNSSISKVTIQNATGAGCSIQYAMEPNLIDIVVVDCGTGIDFDYVVYPKINVTSNSNGVNLNMNYVTGFFVDYSDFSYSTSGDGVIMSNTNNSTFFNTSVNYNTSNGISLTNCHTIAFISYDISFNLVNGLELVSGCDDNQIGLGLIGNNGNTGFKITATSDRNILIASSVRDNTTYGINIAAASCDNNQINSPVFQGNGTNIVNSGTGTLLIGVPSLGLNYTPSAAGTATLNLFNENNHNIAMPAGNITIAVSNATVGQKFLVSITQDSVGSRTVTWFNTIRWVGGSEPLLSTLPNKRDVLGLICTGSGTYDGFVVGLYL